MKKLNLTKEQIAAFFIIILVCLFVFFLKKTYDSNTLEMIQKLELVNKRAEEERMVATLERDSAKIKANILYSEVKKLKEQDKQHELQIKKLDNNYNNSLIILNKIKDEKNYIPTNVSTDEQSKFISNFKYKPY